FAVIAFILILGRGSNSAQQDIQVSRVARSGGTASYDEVSSADIAATVARSSDLLVANNVTNLADSLDAQVEFATTEGSYLIKPQLVPTTNVSREDIVEYTVNE